MIELDVYIDALGKAQPSREILDALVIAGGAFQEIEFDFDPDRRYWSFYGGGVEFTFDNGALLQVNIFIIERDGFNGYKGDLRIGENLPMRHEYVESEIVQLLGAPDFIREARIEQNVGGNRAIAYDKGRVRMMFEFNQRLQWSNLCLIHRC